MSTITRRAMLSTRGRAAVATLSLGGASVAAGLPTGGNTSDDPNAELRRLWTEYQDFDASMLTAWQAVCASRAAFDAEHRPASQGWEWSKETREAYNAALGAHIDGAGLWEISNGLSGKIEKLIVAIRATPAEGLFGVAVKLTALSFQWQGEDVEESVTTAFGDINRILGSDFRLDTGNSLNASSVNVDGGEGRGGRRQCLTPLMMLRSPRR